MSAFAMAHPWLTFALVVIALLVVEGVLTNALRVYAATKGVRTTDGDGKP